MASESAPTMHPRNRDTLEVEIKEALSFAQALRDSSRPLSLTVTKLEEALMWAERIPVRERKPGDPALVVAQPKQPLVEPETPSGEAETPADDVTGGQGEPDAGDTGATGDKGDTEPPAS